MKFKTGSSNVSFDIKLPGSPEGWRKLKAFKKREIDQGSYENVDGGTTYLARRSSSSEDVLDKLG